MNITIFKSLSEINSPHVITLDQAFERIQKGASKLKVESIRQKLQAGEPYDEEKLTLPFVVFSAARTVAVEVKGKMSHRADASVVEHSGVFVLDFDKCDVDQKLEQLRSDPYVLACWVAPSGTGVKALVKCPPNIEQHHLYYTAYLDRYPELDATSRNLSRGTFESYDPNIWINYRSLVWDKKLTEEDRKKNKEKVANRRGTKIISTAVGMVRASYDGTKHESLLKAANLLGGFIASGRVSEEDAIRVLEDEIKAKNPKDFSGAQQTIRDGIARGKTMPIHESKKLEKSVEFIKRDDGSYDFLADESELDEYLLALINGTLEQGQPTGMTWLNSHFLFKKHTMCFVIGADNVGKSFLLWYFAVLAAMMHGWKVIIHSAENGDGELRKKLMEFYMGKSAKVMDDEELTIARDFVKEHFRIVSSTQMHTVDDYLLKCEILIDEGFEATLVIAEPWNSFEIPGTSDTYRHNIHCLNMLRVFKENYCSVYVGDHINTSAARAKDGEGYALPPNKSDAEMGQMKANKTDDMLIVHRLGNHPDKKNDTQIHVQKIKSVETGGFPTPKDEPVLLVMNGDFCGYTCNGQDPVREYWYKRNKI